MEPTGYAKPEEMILRGQAVDKLALDIGVGRAEAGGLQAMAGRGVHLRAQALERKPVQAAVGALEVAASNGVGDHFVNEVEVEDFAEKAFVADGRGAGGIEGLEGGGIAADGFESAVTLGDDLAEGGAAGFLATVEHLFNGGGHRGLEGGGEFVEFAEMFLGDGFRGGNRRRRHGRGRRHRHGTYGRDVLFDRPLYEFGDGDATTGRFCLQAPLAIR